MEQFLAERYLTRAEMARDAELLRALAARSDIRLLQTVYIPEDEVCFYLFESESRDRVVELASFDRVSPAVAQ